MLGLERKKLSLPKYLGPITQLAEEAGLLEVVEFSFASKIT